MVGEDNYTTAKRILTDELNTIDLTLNDTQTSIEKGRKVLKQRLIAVFKSVRIICQMKNLNKLQNQITDNINGMLKKILKSKNLDDISDPLIQEFEKIKTAAKEL